MTPLHPAPIVSPAEVALHWTPLVTLAGYSAYAFVRYTMTPRVSLRKAVVSVATTEPVVEATVQSGSNSAPAPSDVTSGTENAPQANSGNPPPD